MKKIPAYIVMLSAVSLSATAQSRLKHTEKAAEWTDNPVIHALPQEYNKESALMLMHDVTFDYRYEGKQIEVFYTQHRLVKVMDSKGIDMFNKVSIPVPARTRVPLIKARTILPNGKVLDIAKENIKVTRNEYGQHEIVFAMEGVEKNAEVELLVQEIRPLSLFGSESFQYSVPVLSTHFDINYPKELVFEEKGYNGFPDVKDTLRNNRRHISVAVADIPALHKEPNSFYDLHRMRAEYRISKFIDANDYDAARIYTWDQMARQLYDEYYTVTDKEREAVNKFLVTLGANNTQTPAEKIRHIEDGIKNTITLYPEMDEANGDVLDSIINNKAATQTGMIRLFAACFSQAEVKHELGLAGNRREHHFDSKFENWGNMQNHIFYFPGEKKFLAPVSVYDRYPFVPDEVQGTKGVFCTIPATHDVTGALMEVRTIAPLGVADNKQNIAAGVSFGKDMDAQVDIAYSYTGYAASNLRRELMLQAGSKEKETVNRVVTIADKPENLLKYTIANEGMNKSYSNTPLEITASVNASDLTERAGSQYLFKVGQLIGPHTSLYNEQQRVMPVDLDYPVSMSRTITINIPKGYKVMNAGDLKMHADYVNRSLQPVISFNADYQLKTDKKNGDKLVVTVTENYPQTHFGINDYERYRTVVNTAADFNKVTLLLAKKS